MSSSFLSDPKREHFESTSRHGSVAFEWSKESGNTPDLSHHHQDSNNNNSSSSTTQNNNNSTNVNNNNNVSSPSTAVEMNRTGNNQQQYSPIQSANSNDSKNANNNNSNSNDNNNSLSSILNSSLSPQMLQERIQRFFIPVQIVGVLLFNPTISIDDDTSEANILFSERRSVWGTAGKNTNHKDHVAHAVPNHAGLCSGFKGLASIFCKPSFSSSSKSSSSASSGNKNKNTTSNNDSSSSSSPRKGNHQEAETTRELPGVRFVTQVRGFHVFICPEPNFYIVITIERPSSYASTDSLVVDEINSWTQTFIDTIRVVHGSFSKMFNTCLEHQRKTVKQFVEQQYEQNGGKMPSAKKIESRARVSAARDVCTKVAPLCHNLYNFLNEQIKILFAGPCMLSCTSNLYNISTQQGISNASFSFQNQQQLAAAMNNNNNNNNMMKRTGSSNALSAPDFSTTANNNNGAHPSSSAAFLTAPNSNNNTAARANSQQQQQQQQQQQHPNSLPHNQFSPAVPLFGPLSLAATSQEFRMAASVCCARLLDAHISLLRHVVILDSMSVLSPLSRTSLAPTIVASSLPPAAVSSLLSAIALYKPPNSSSSSSSMNHNNNSSSTQNFSGHDLLSSSVVPGGGAGGISSSTTTATPSSPMTRQEQQQQSMLAGIRAGACRFLRVAKLKGDGSEELVDESKKKKKRSEQHNNSHHHHSPSDWGSCRGVRLQPKQMTTASDGKEKEKEKNNNNNNDNENSSSSLLPPDEHDISQYERNELWLFQLGQHLVVCCEAKSSLLSVPGSRASLIQEICHFLSGGGLVVSSSKTSKNTDTNENNKANFSSNSLDGSTSAAGMIFDAEDSQAEKNRKVVQKLLDCAEDYFSHQLSQRSGATGLLASVMNGSKNSSSSSKNKKSKSGSGAEADRNRSKSPRDNGRRSSKDHNHSEEKIERTNVAAATVDEFPHFLENSSLRIGTANTQTKWFPPSESEVKHALAAANTAAAMVANHQQHQPTPPLTSSASSLHPSPNNTASSFPTTPILPANASSSSSMNFPSSSSAFSQQQQQQRSVMVPPQPTPRQTAQSRQMQLALQVSTLKPQEDDLLYGPPSFILKNLLHAQSENTAVRLESFAQAQRKLSHDKNNNNKTITKNHQTKRSLIGGGGGAGRASSSASSSVPPTSSSTGRHQQFPGGVRFDPSPPKESYFDSIFENFTQEDANWFTRGSSTYGNTILSLVTDRQNPTSNGAIENVRTAKNNKTVQKLLTCDAYEEDFVVGGGNNSNNTRKHNSGTLTTTNTNSGLENGDDDENNSNEKITLSLADLGGSQNNLVGDDANVFVDNNNNQQNTNTTQNNNNIQQQPSTTTFTPSLMTTLLTQRQERWAFASADGDRVAAIVDNLALNGEEAAETGRRAMRMFGMHNAVNL